MWHKSDNRESIKVVALSPMPHSVARGVLKQGGLSISLIALNFMDFFAP